MGEVRGVPPVSYELVVRACEGADRVPVWLALGGVLSKRPDWQFGISDDGAATAFWTWTAHPEYWATAEQYPDQAPKWELFRQDGDDEESMWELPNPEALPLLAEAIAAGAPQPEAVRLRRVDRGALPRVDERRSAAPLGEVGRRGALNGVTRAAGYFVTLTKRSYFVPVSAGDSPPSRKATDPDASFSGQASGTDQAPNGPSLGYRPGTERAKLRYRTGRQRAKPRYRTGRRRAKPTGQASVVAAARMPA